MTDTQAQEAARLAIASDALADEREMIHLCSWVEIRNLLRADAAILRSQAARIVELDEQIAELRKSLQREAQRTHDRNVEIIELHGENKALRAELARMREPLYEALVRLLGSDPDGAIANASEDELTGAANDANAHPVVREQAASVLQARAAAREYEAAHGITKTGEQK